MKKVRNVVARLAIMRKGGIHDKSNKAKRQKQKQKLARQIRTKDFGPFLLFEILLFEKSKNFQKINIYQESFIKFR